MAEENSIGAPRIKDFDFVRFTFSDIHGIGRSRTVCKSSVGKLMESGVGVFVGSIGFGIRGDIDAYLELCNDHPEVKGRMYGNCMVLPVPGTLHPLSTAGAGKYRVGEVLCETFYAWNRARQQECPRFIACRELDRLKDLGFDLLSSFEVEFCLMSKLSKEPVTELYNVIVNQIFTKFENVLLEISETLGAMGIEVETLQTEYGAGQFELTLTPQFGIKMADNVFQAKDCIRAIADKHGYLAVFMTKPSDAPISNGMHFNHSIKSVTTGQNAFSDISKSDLMSDEIHQWLGGLTKHFLALIALCCPTVNCYRRLHQPWAPSCSDWSIDDRQAGYRVKAESPTATYVESRLPSGSSNPYLVMAATVAAGIDGLKNKIIPPPPTSGIEGGNTRRYSDAKITHAPNELGKSLTALGKDDCISSALDHTFVQWFIGLKKQEVADVTKSITAEKDALSIEKEMYLQLL